MGHTLAHTDAVFPEKYPTYVETRISGTIQVFHLLSTRDLILIYSPVEKERTGLHYHLAVPAGHEVAGTSMVPGWWVAWEVMVVASSTGSKPVGNTLDYSNVVQAQADNLEVPSVAEPVDAVVDIEHRNVKEYLLHYCFVIVKKG